jgi:hypothetical protein
MGAALMTRSTRVGSWLLLLTTVLVLGGCILYVTDSVGWAQLLWVMASGTAGAGIVLFTERR